MKYNNWPIFIFYIFYIFIIDGPVLYFYIYIIYYNYYMRDRKGI